MADEGLLGVPMSFGIGDTLLGSLGTGLAQASPKMISPYASTGTAIGLGLGSVLLQSLLGYQARQQAADRTIELNKLSTPLLGMQTAQERSDYLSGLEDTDPLVLGRLSRLSGALGTRAIEQQQALDLARRKQELGYEMELSPDAQKLQELKQQRELQLINARGNNLLRNLIPQTEPRIENELDAIITRRFGRIGIAARDKLKFLTKEELETLPIAEAKARALETYNRLKKSQLPIAQQYLSKEEIEILPENEQLVLGQERQAEAKQKGRRDIEKMRQTAISGRQKEAYEQKVNYRNLEIKYPKLPTALLTSAAETMGSLTLASDVLEEIPNIDNWLDLQLTKKFAGYGEGELQSRLTNLASRILLSRSGKAATDYERKLLKQMTEGDFSVGPKAFRRILNRFITDEAKVQSQTLGAARLGAKGLADQFKDIATTGYVPVFTEFDELGSPSAQTKQGLDADTEKYLKIYNNPPSEKHRELAEQLLRKRGVL
jgi:hypothetical protein